MLFVDEDDNGIESYMVTNEQGLCLIRTTSRAIAHFVNQHSKIPAGYFLVVGGDPKSRRKTNRPIFHHIKR